MTTGEDLRYDISDQIAEICCCRRRLCAGGGMTLAISCDVLVAGRSASFGYPEVDLGFVPAIRCGWGALLSYVSAIWITGAALVMRWRISATSPRLLTLRKEYGRSSKNAHRIGSRWQMAFSGSRVPISERFARSKTACASTICFREAPRHHRMGGFKP